MSGKLFVHITSPADRDLLRRVPLPLGWMPTLEYAYRGRRTLGMHAAAAPGLVVDPVTVRLDAGLGWSIAGDGELKPQYREIWNAALAGLSQSRYEAWRAGSRLDRRTFVENVFDLQLRVLDPTRSLDLDLFDIVSPPESSRRTRPDFLFVPYVLIRSYRDLEEQLRLFEAAGDDYMGWPVERVLFFDPWFLSRADPRDLTRDLNARGRIWVGVPDLRETIPTRTGARVVPRLCEVIRSLSARGPVGLLGAGFFLSTLVSVGATSVAFGTHMEGAHRVKRSGAPVAYAYVSAVHGWVAYRDVARQVGRCESAAEVAALFCPEAECVGLFEALGPHEFARRLFSVAETGAPTAKARRLQDEHALRARVFEIGRMAGRSPEDVARLLIGDIAGSPFRDPAALVRRWCVLIGLERQAAA